MMWISRQGLDPRLLLPLLRKASAQSLTMANIPARQVYRLLTVEIHISALLRLWTVKSERSVQLPQISPDTDWTTTPNITLRITSILCVDSPQVEHLYISFTTAACHFGPLLPISKATKQFSSSRRGSISLYGTCSLLAQ